MFDSKDEIITIRSSFNGRFFIVDGENSLAITLRAMEFGRLFSAITEKDRSIFKCVRLFKPIPLQELSKQC